MGNGQALVPEARSKNGFRMMYELYKIEIGARESWESGFFWPL